MDNVEPSIQPEATETQTPAVTSKSMVSKMEDRFKNMELIPKHEFEHKSVLMRSSKLQDKADLQDLVNKDILLANISDDKLLRVFQMEFKNVMEWMDMGMWSSVGQYFYENLRADLALSRSRNNAERLFQAGVIPDTSGPTLKVVGEFFRKSETDRERAARQNQEKPLGKYIGGEEQYA